MNPRNSYLFIPMLGCLLNASKGSEDRITPSLGQVRYTLNAGQFSQRIAGSEILAIHENSAEFLAPLSSFEDRDRLAKLSHEATNLCGSIDYYPPGYRLTTTVSHTAPYFSHRYTFSSLETIIQDADLSRMNDTLTTLTSLGTRFHRHSTGQNAGTTVQSLWNNQITTSGDWNLELITHSSTPQKSVVAKLSGTSAETVVLGAHLDSINSIDGTEGSAPGADDDGSGIAILTEILRIIEARGLRFHKTVELQAYAAEEVGLVGSRAIASSYKTASRKIAGMMQFDMAYYSESADLGKIFFLEDYTSPDLFRGSITLMKNYISSNYARGFLPKGAASDHKAYWEQGYPTVFPFENPKADNPYIHTENDNMSQFDDGLRMKRMVQLGLLFLSYQAGLVSLDTQAETEKTRLKQENIAKDIFLNLSGSDGTYTFQASAPSETTYLEFCQIDAADDFRCSGARQKLSASETLNQRAQFIGESAFASAQSYRIEAYDASDNLIARRHITLE